MVVVAEECNLAQQQPVQGIALFFQLRHIQVIGALIADQSHPLPVGLYGQPPSQPNRLIQAGGPICQRVFTLLVDLSTDKNRAALVFHHLDLDIRRLQIPAERTLQVTVKIGRASCRERVSSPV